MRKSLVRYLPFVLCFLFFFMLASTVALAQSGSADPFGLEQAVQGTGVPQEKLTSERSIIATLIFNLMSMVGVIFLILIIWAGIMWMTSGGNEQRVSRAKSILTTATIGLVVVLTAYSITYLITQSLTEASGGGSYATCYPKEFIGPLPQGASYCD